MNRTYVKKKIKEILGHPGVLLYKLDYTTLKYVMKKLFSECSEFKFIHSMTGINLKRFKEYSKDFENHRGFLNKIGQQYYRARKAYPVYQEWHKVIYLLVRTYKPKIMFETGVFDGLSSMLILKAMEDNQKGCLISFDIPPREPIKHSTNMMVFTHLPKNFKSGWVVPTDLKHRWELHLGDTKKILPHTLEKHKKIDIFLHDSLHTYDHMYWEYATSWLCIKKKGILLSDDVYFNNAFRDFSTEISRKRYTIHDFGGIIK